MGEIRFLHDHFYLCESELVLLVLSSDFCLDMIMLVFGTSVAEEAFLYVDLSAVQAFHDRRFRLTNLAV